MDKTLSKFKMDSPIKTSNKVNQYTKTAINFLYKISFKYSKIIKYIIVLFNKIINYFLNNNFQFENEFYSLQLF